MNSSYKTALSRLTLVPEREFALGSDGFTGALYRPAVDEYPGKAVIMFGGSDGIYPLTRLLAEQYVARGMTVLALAYWNEPGLPNAFEKVPAESVEKAALRLRGQGFEKIGLWGISMGAELALIAGSLMPELISCVTAVCPTNICGQGFMKKKGIKALECSAFSWRGSEIPWVRLRISKLEILRDSLRERSVCLRSCYEDAVQNAPEEAQIKVENLGGPLLMLLPEHDAMWCSELSTDKIEARLKENGFAYPCECVRYKYASHMLVPITSRSKKMFRVEREHPDECQKSDSDAFEKTLAFWKEVWQDELPRR